MKEKPARGRNIKLRTRCYGDGKEDKGTSNRYTLLPDEFQEIYISTNLNGKF